MPLTAEYVFEQFGFVFNSTVPHEWLKALIGCDVVYLIPGPFTILERAENPLPRIVGEYLFMYPHGSTGLSSGGILVFLALGFRTGPEPLVDWRDPISLVGS
jgi:hypothetical protein